SDQYRVAHLLRRTTFGATPEEFERAASDGFKKTVERLLTEPPQEPPDFLHGNPENGVGYKIAELQLWWIRHLLTTRTPFAERLTYFWHGHFTSDYQKVGTRTPFLYWQNRTWRRIALEPFHTMLQEVTSDPAMLRYLDLDTSLGTAPNENYARELMELFTMGLHYTEDDVRAAAKGLAGWVPPKPDGTTTRTLDTQNGVVRQYALYDRQKAGRLAARRAYHGPPFAFFGKVAQWDTEGVLNQILAQEWTAPFIARAVAQEFLSRTPDASFVSWLGGRFRHSGYDVRGLFSDLLTSDQFAADQAYRMLVKSPTEFMVSVLKALQAPQLATLAVQSAPDLGQALFDPPDVSGWPQNDAWISSNQMLMRVDFVTKALLRLRSLPASKSALSQQLDGVLAPPTASALRKAASEQQRWFLLLAGPEFQLK
ncbi:MAG: DUF1800 family protein, partial [Candidatus Dormiibacterota bacterium]